MVKRTYQPKKIRHRRTHGYLTRTSTKTGRQIIKARRLKGRHRLTA
jgi:large subunit ribosomal protein L34